MASTVTTSRIGPQHHGTRMPLSEFAQIEGQSGYLYELDKGVILVVEVPGTSHMLVRLAIRDALVAYRLANTSRVCAIADGSDAALRMPAMQSERHPDIAVYLTPPPVDDDQPWEYWVPEIVVEVVSKGGEERDFKIKRDEYLKAGVRLYWIADPEDRSVSVLLRRADTWDEKRLGEGGTLTTPLLPGLEIKLSDVFGVLPDAARRHRG